MFADEFLDFMLVLAVLQAEINPFFFLFFLVFIKANPEKRWIRHFYFYLRKSKNKKGLKLFFIEKQFFFN